MPRPYLPPGETYALTLRHDVGIRLAESYIATRLGIPQHWMRHFLVEGRVQIDGATLTPDETRPFRRGMHITVAVPEAWPPHMAATPMPLSILHEDADLVVLDKPPGVVVHPARGHMDGRTLQNGLLHRYADERGREGVTIGPCHRIDRDTSGVAVFSRTRAAYRNLTAQFADHGAVQKTYLAFVDGAPDWETTTCDAPLMEDPADDKRALVALVENGGKPAHTTFHVRARGERCALVEAAPRTGRGHQIRVHLAELGHPILGDNTYNTNAPSAHVRRQALHAWQLALRHPITNLPLTFTAPLPDDLASLQTALGISS